jgi:hypothetical protein
MRDTPAHVLDAIPMLYRTILLAIAAISISSEVRAGGPWATEAGHYNLYFGYSRKTGINSWDGFGTFVQPDPATLANGLRHDFRYAYLNPSVGIVNDLELGGSFLYLFGYESVKTDPNGKANLHMEYNAGLTDFWLYAKYQVMHGDYPVAVMVNSRFPDFYDQQGPYTRYVQRIFVKGKGASTVRDTEYTPSSEWRGVLRRDVGIFLLTGHSFGSQAYAQAQAGYNFRQGAAADQVNFQLEGGYNIPVLQDGQVTIKGLFDYTGGIGNGAPPTPDDRFASFDSTGAPIVNNNFNDGRYGRLYGSVIFVPSFAMHLSFEAGLGKWIFGRGAVEYTEVYFQTGYSL